MEVVVNAKELLAAAKFAENKKNKGCRELLRCVHVESNHDDYTLAATDSYKLIEFTRVVPGNARDIENIFACNIGIDIIKSSVKSSDEIVKIEFDAETHKVTLDIYDKRINLRSTVTTQANEGTYPNYKKLLSDTKKKETECNSIRLNATYLASICNAIEQAYGKETHIDFELYEETTAVWFGSAEEEGKVYCEGIIMPVRK